jgi:hypothetical protein
MTVAAHPKPKERHRATIVVATQPDGRERCNSQTKAGRSEYRWRTIEMWERQKGLCCLCHQPMTQQEATFDHEHGRGMGGSRRDDRITLPDGSWINGAAHLFCNVAKGSSFIDYNGSQK